MKESMKIQIAISALFLTVSSLSYGQAAPAGVAAIAVSPASPTLPTLDGVLHYALSASEVVQLGYYGAGDVTSSSAISGDVAYSGKSTARPFSLLFAGGVLLPNQGGQGVSTFWNAAVSQGYVTRKWVFNVSDSFSFLPESPTTGLSGIAGVGDLGATPVSGPVVGPAGGVFSVAGNRISNYLGGSVERQLNHDTSISGSGSWGTLHFLDDNASELGLDSDQYSGVVSLNHRIDQRSTVAVNAVYSEFVYSGSGALQSEPDFQSRGLNLSYSRVLSRSLNVSASVGPQWVSSSNSALIPTSLDVAVSASLSYSRRYTNASLTYTRGVNSGSGVLPGALSDSVMGGIGRAYGRNWVVSLDAAYTHTSGLTVFGIASGTPTNEAFNTVYGGGQVTRRISSTFSGYVSYTAQHQSSTNQLFVQNALNGSSQTFGIGITYSPRSTRLGQF